MSKVVIERPRYGHKDPSKKTKLRIRRYDPDNEYESSPKRLPASKGRGTKMFSDFLTPLERFLRSNVGRPWDKVYGELCEHLDRRKTTGRHVFEHLEDYVETNCFFGEDGEIYACTERDGIQRVHERSRRWMMFYVHPRSGLLCRREKRPSESDREEQKRTARKEIKRIPISVNQSYIRINGVWYIGDYVPDEDEAPYDPSADRPGHVSNFRKLKLKAEELGLRYWDGKRWMQLVGKRKCSQQELQKAGLKNANPAK